MAARPVMRVAAVTIGAPDPRELAAFYARMLGWPVTAADPPRPGAAPEDGWAQLRPPTGQSGPTLNFEYEADYVPPVWPSVAGRPQIMEHLDIAVGDLAETVAWAVGAGATLADHQPQQDVRVMLDPAGHPFCLFLVASLGAPPDEAA
jgi:catechol 2,3-dioxygenase-like lactoylglutathione lyase family enzyme